MSWQIGDLAKIFFGFKPVCDRGECSCGARIIRTRLQNKEAIEIKKKWKRDQIRAQGKNLYRDFNKNSRVRNAEVK